MSTERPMPAPDIDAALEIALRDLGSALETQPRAGDLAAAVSRRIQAERPHRATATWLRLGGAAVPRLRRSTLLAAAALLVAAAAVAAAIGYGLPGIRIFFGPPPSIAPTPTISASAAPGATLGLGTPITLDEARALVDFEVLLPPDPAIGPPEAVYLAGSRIALAWAPAPVLPGTAAAGLGLLLLELRATVDGNWIEKLIQAGTHVERITVDGADGYWISGERHFLTFIAPDGAVIEDATREVGNTLMWTRDGVTYRLEGDFERDSALALALELR